MTGNDRIALALVAGALAVAVAIVVSVVLYPRTVEERVPERPELSAVYVEMED